MLNKQIKNFLNLIEYYKQKAYQAVRINILSIDEEKVLCQGCKNSKVVINKDGKSYEYRYDENGKQTLEIK